MRGEDRDPSPRHARVADACRGFESAWDSGKRPRIEDFLREADDADRSSLLRELVALELGLRARRGESPTLADYECRFPGETSAFSDAFTRTLDTRVEAVDGDRTGDYDPRDRRAWSPGGGLTDRYRLIRSHARGGLGEVFVAHDLEVGREVALKQILDSHARDARSRERFVYEAEVTGRLEHPGIVPIYGLGTDADGLPFYAMRLIRGDTLKQAIDRFHAGDAGPGHDPGERALALQKLLRRFLDVCNAVDYAHSRGVLHRDLKPSNVMLGPYGETLVVDWGLAKPMEEVPDKAIRPVEQLPPGLDPTLIGSAVGTPAFMSPEQADGRPDRARPTSDVYSLGATLYELLVGQPAFRDPDLSRLLEKVRRADFPAPRGLDPRISPALEAICLKAMALDPASRYGSARDLAGDLEHWLADEPIGAYREPMPARLGRWAKRHRPAVAAAAGVMLVAILALAASTILIGREQARTSEQRREAIRQRDRAEANFRKARRAVDDYLSRVGKSKLLNVPGLQPLRKELLEDALRYYEDFVIERGNDVSLRDELAISLLRVASITALMGKKDEAIQVYQRAIALLEGLEPGQRNDLNRRDLASAYDNLGLLIRELHRPGGDDEAMRWIDQSLALRRQLLAEHPDDPFLMRELASTENDLGIFLRAIGRLDEAIPHYERSVELRETIVRLVPDDEFKSALALGLMNLGNLRRGLGQLDRAEADWKRSREQLESLLSRHPDSPHDKALLAEVWGNLAIVYTVPGKEPARLEAHEKARKLWDELVRENPSVVSYEIGQADNEYNLATFLGELGRIDEAAEGYRRCLRAYLRRHQAEPDNPVYRSDLAECHEALGLLLLRAKRLAEAAPCYREACRLREPPVDADPRSQTILAQDLEMVAALDAEEGRHQESVLASRRAIGLRLREWAKLPGDPKHRDAIRRSYDLLHRQLDAAGRPDEALAAIEEWVASEFATAADLVEVASLWMRRSRRSPKEASALTTQALAMIRRALALGYSDRKRLETDPSFLDLRRRDDFRSLILDLGFPADPFAR